MPAPDHKKTEQLGIPHGTASARLRKSLMFSLAKKCELITCHQCGEEIETEQELSIDHKIPWLDSDNPVGLFYDLDNIAFSHLKCNIAAARKTAKKYHTVKERLEANRRLDRESKRRNYSKEKRRKKYVEKEY